MKKYYLITVTILLTLFIGVTSCNKDAFAPLPDYGDMPENLRINHTNPKTGEDYTQEELDALDYNPEEEEFYDLEQPVDLALVTNIRPSRVEVIGSDGTILETIVDFSPFGDELISSIFSTSLTALGIEPGENARINFRSYFTFGEGLAIVNTKFKINFIGESKNDPTGFQLVRQSGENQFLAVKDFADREVEVFEDLRYGYDYTVASEWGVVPDEDDLLDFRKTDNFSIAFWVKTTADNSDPSMIGDQDWDDGDNPGFTIAFKGDNWKVAIGGSSGDVSAGTDSSNPFNDGEWHLLAVTFDKSGDVTLYQDGVNVASNDMSGVGTMDSGFDLHLAQDGTGLYGDAFIGAIAESRIFDWVLSPEEVEDISMDPSFPLLLQKSSGELVALPTILNNVDGVSSFEGNRKGYDFTDDGVNQYVLIDDAEEGILDFRKADDFSVSFWVNTTADNSDPSMFGDQDWDDGDNPGFTIAFRGDNWKVALGGSSGDVSAGTDSSNPFNDGQWHLLTVTFDRGGDVTLYQDGVNVASNDMSGIGVMDSGFGLHLAQDGTGNYGDLFKAKMSNTVIYDWALTAGEVQNLLN